jgi:acylpyruvate hydrolase
MRLVTFTSLDTRPRLGALVSLGDQDAVLDLGRAEPRLPTEMIAFLAEGAPALALARAAVASASSQHCLPRSQVTLLAPVLRPGKILCIGHNYSDHIGAGRTTPAEYPNFFVKTANTIIGPGQPIVVPRITQEVDYEAELAVVIGRQARDVDEDHALECVAGYTIFNDVSARDYQKRSSQWMLGKSFDTFGPLGPALVTPDEIPNLYHLELSLTLNGQEMQRTNTGQMIFSVAYQISYLSQAMTLEPGDILSTGTPAKTELAKTLPPFMKPGDEVSIHIEKIGQLINPLVAEA